MKLLLSIFFLMLGLQIMSIAQPNYTVLETPKVLLKNNQNSYTINITGVDMDNITATLKKQLQAAGGVAIEKLTNGAIGFKEVLLPKISKDAIQVYFKTYEDTESVSTHLTLWFKDGDKFISSHAMPDSFKPISRMLIQFSFDVEDILSKSIKVNDLERAKEEYPASKN